tara:strand:- start:846 stop:1481 length:636 start_codon:yes stop_codon:yes gene_type:complete
MRVNVLGNGDNAGIFERGTSGRLLVCNMPPFEIPRKEVYATCMVDFKMMKALQEGHIKLDMYDWILGTRPKIWMEKQGTFYLKYSHLIKGFYPHVPEYAIGNGDPRMAATNFNCGHMAVHYACTKMKATEVHIYGFDSIFDMNLESFTDLLLESDRSTQNTVRLAGNWRPIWTHMFNEFPNVEFNLYHCHKNIKIQVGDNVKIHTKVHKKS